MLNGERSGVCNEATQDRNLLLLLSDDFLGKAPELVVMAVLELRFRQIYRALMLSDHVGGEVAIDIASRRGRASPGSCC